jgi:hypothetical protein
LLDRLKALFSEHRGVVDFIHYRLRGDPERQIPSMLGEPARQLLRPEIIFDHFQDRIRERSESQVYVERVYESYREEIPELFADPAQQNAALAAVKLLILFAISPSKYLYTVRHMAEMILFLVTRLDSQINYQFLQDILERLVREGSYVKVDRRDDPMENHYFIDLKADVAGMMRRRIRHEAAQIFPEDHRLFTKLGPMVQSSHLPLGAWLEREQQPMALQWRHTRRRGTLLLRQLDRITLEEIERLALQWERSEEDFFLFVGTTVQPDRQYDHVRKAILPHVIARYPTCFCSGFLLSWKMSLPG